MTQTNCLSPPAPTAAYRARAEALATPSGGPAMLSADADLWVASHAQNEREAARAIVNSITRITRPAFDTAFAAGLNALAVARSPILPLVPIVDDKNYSTSNAWMTARARLSGRLQLEATHHLTDHRPDAACQFLPVDALRQAAVELVLFDDASYSGEQLRQHIDTLAECICRLNMDCAHVYVVVAAISGNARMHIHEAGDQLRCPLSILGDPRTIQNVRELVPQGSLRADHLQLLKARYALPFNDYEGENTPAEDEHEFAAMTLTYLPHKVPDETSFVGGIAQATIPAHQAGGAKARRTLFAPIAPPYKQDRVQAQIHAVECDPSLRSTWLHQDPHQDLAQWAVNTFCTP